MKKIIIIGAGPCGLFTATQLLQNTDIKVELYDHKASIGNKFLVAGKSGLNLTHSQNRDDFSKNYYEEESRFKKWFERFDNHDLIKWTHDLGIKTFNGSSGRVFPEEFKAAQFLKIWFDHLKSFENFSFHPKSKFTDFDTNTVTINGNKHQFDKLVLALGGGSWKKTGSTGEWVNSFEKNNIELQDFYALNCGFNCTWSSNFITDDMTYPVKYVNLSYGDKCIKGDFMLTEWGVEGSPVYFLSHYIQNDQLSKKLIIDLKPDLSIEAINKKIAGKKSISSKLKSLLDENAIKLLKELTTKEEFLNRDTLAFKIKNLELNLDSPRPIDEAISTGGGVKFSELTEQLALKKFPNVYIGGEMIDWDAPTGGYLLQACFTQATIIADNASS